MDLVLHYAIFSDFYESVTDGPMDGPTDRRTDGPTDTPSYRDARTHLKTKQFPFKMCHQLKMKNKRPIRDLNP